MEDKDAELMLRFKEGDDSTFERLFEKYKKPVLNMIYRFIGTKAEAEELTQEVFLKVYQARYSYEVRAKFATWLYRIAKNLCFNWIRHKRIIRFFSTDNPFRAPEVEVYREIPDSSQDPADIVLEKKEMAEQIQNALRSLPENQRITIILKEYERKSYDEIAQILGHSVSSVKAIIFRARENLRHLLSKYFERDKDIGR
ncbi:RNA polymerase subunit sigma-24 [Candidatus Desantisbacteria bacterium CG_4_10_14_0_8_um_filter_48_22]|uniref:RNA polymerase sigma factor n=1 Tax=Candidatus Desantisbacteria bacterium CG_4_10_14_0_8_um_filter_48_22 TaxID=1974543 RepID=A0A2M7SEP5_9BACT|nr:MAG: RNA polymerase subunit sigma-24 [Candidatus Desantisbacteria bacterium CG02_land_8_20_14_3_00_49_13]PIZ18005.1 MAG: RNA polymerase subunit sigma-24 [Candidatus Desantisbacteria bacterium CG_4_10_14_0_8_um_filter_48_22]